MNLTDKFSMIMSHIVGDNDAMPRGECTEVSPVRQRKCTDVDP